MMLHVSLTYTHLRLGVLKDSPEVQAKEIVEALKVLNKESEIMTPEKRVKE